MSKKKGEPASVEFGRRKVFLKAERGQHFILDSEAITKLAGEIPEGATVIEIGAGNGRLTEELAKNAKAVCQVPVFRDTLSASRNCLLNRTGDILREV